MSQLALVGTTYNKHIKTKTKDKDIYSIKDKMKFILTKSWPFQVESNHIMEMSILTF